MVADEDDTINITIYFWINSLFDSKRLTLMVIMNFNLLKPILMKWKTCKSEKEGLQKCKFVKIVLALE